MGSKMVHQFVTRYRLYPGGHRLLAAIGMPRVVHRQQGFLQQVFDLGRLQSAPEEAAQMRAELRQELPIGLLVAVQPQQ